MGFTFKGNVPDTRNTKVVDLIRRLGDFMAEVAGEPRTGSTSCKL